MLSKQYHRSVSFPAPKSSPPITAARRAALAKASYRTRSASLPTRLHPLSAHLDADLASLFDWSNLPEPNLPDGLALLHALLDNLPNLLRLPQSAISLSFAHRLLDDFLLLADAHQSFRQASIELKHCVSATRIALRRAPGEPRRVSLCIRAQRRAERHVARLAGTVRHVGNRLPVVGGGDDVAEVASAMRKVVIETAEASAIVFEGAAAEAERAMVRGRITWLEEGLMRWRSRARAKGVLRREIGDSTVENAMRRWLARAREKSRGVGEEGIVESAMRRWVDRAREKSGGSPSGVVENALRRWLDRVRSKTEENSSGVVEGKGKARSGKKKGDVEAGLMRWLSRAKERMGIGGVSSHELGETVVQTMGGKAIIDEINENENSEGQKEGEMSFDEFKDYELQKAAMNRLTVLEDRVAALESGSELVFRDLINVRVALLNKLTPCF